MGFHLISKNVLLPVEPWGDENVIGIRAFKLVEFSAVIDNLRISHNASGMGANIRVLVT